MTDALKVSRPQELGYSRVELTGDPKQMVTLFHAGGAMTTRRVSDCLPDVTAWLTSGWDGPYARAW